jgi:hypothetical protein
MAKKHQSLVTLVVASKMKVAVIAVAAVLGVLCSVAVTNANAAHAVFIQTIAKIGLADNPAPMPVCTINGAPAKDWHWDSAQNKCVKNAPVAGQTCTTTKDNVVVCVANPVATIGGKSVSSSDMASGHVIIAQDMNLKGTQYNSPKVFWTKNGCWNSSRVNGKLRSYWDPVSCKLCPNRNSKTGWVKCGGGTTGADCSNVASPKHAPYPVIKGKIISVSNITKIVIPIRAEAQAHVGLPNSDCYAEAHGSVNGSMRLSLFIKAKGQVNLRVFGNELVKVSTRASAKANCTPVTTTVSTTVQSPPVTTVITQPGTTSTVHTTTTVPTTTTVVTTTTQTTTTTPTTTVQPKSDVDLCINIDGVQTAVPAMYQKDPPDQNTPGNCYYVGP